MKTEVELNQSRLTDAAGHTIIKVTKVSVTGEPNSITQITHAKGGIDRNYYDASGRQFKQISNNDHGRPKTHPFGKHGEHAHDYTYDSNGRLQRGAPREFYEFERKDNGDFL